MSKKKSIFFNKLRAVFSTTKPVAKVDVVDTESAESFLLNTTTSDVAKKMYKELLREETEMHALKVQTALNDGVLFNEEMLGMYDLPDLVNSNVTFNILDLTSKTKCEIVFHVTLKIYELHHVALANIGAVPNIYAAYMEMCGKTSGSSISCDNDRGKINQAEQIMLYGLVTVLRNALSTDFSDYPVDVGGNQLLTINNLVTFMKSQQHMLENNPLFVDDARNELIQDRLKLDVKALERVKTILQGV